MAARHPLLRAATALTLWVLALMPAAAAAQAVAGVEIDWDAPASCPAHDGLLYETRRLLGPDFRHSGALEVELTVEERGSGFALQLEFDGDGAAGSRSLQLESCAQVHEAAALLIALMLNPDLQVPEAEPEPEPEPEAEAEPEPEPEPEPEASAEVEEGDAAPGSLQLLLGLPLVLVDSGLLPGVSAGVGGFAGIRVGELQLELGASYLFARAAQVAVGTPGALGSGYEVSVDALWGQARVCLLLARLGGIPLGPCASMSVGRLGAEAGVTGAPQGAELLLVAAPGLVLQPRFNSLISLRFGAFLGIPLRAPRVAVRSAGQVATVHEPDALTALLELSVVFHP